jgi:hypothetical protein
LKIHEMATGPASLDLQSAAGPTGWLQLAAVPIEIAVAILLLVNRWPRMAWGSAVGLFAVFAIFSATGIEAGNQTCGCFGTHSPSPTTALVLDLFVVFALLMVGPYSSSIGLSRHAGSVRLRGWIVPRRRLVLVGGVGAFLVGWQVAKFQIPQPLHVDAKYLDIGEQWEQENFKWVLPVWILVEPESGGNSFELVKPIRYFGLAEAQASPTSVITTGLGASNGQ